MKNILTVLVCIFTVQFFCIGQDVITYAGTGKRGFSNGLKDTSTFSYPYGICLDPFGNIYISDTYNNVIRKIGPEGIVTTFAGSGLKGSNDGFGLDASFNFPKGICSDLIGNIYVADFANFNIRKITPLGQVSTYAGLTKWGGLDGNVSVAGFNLPTGVCSDINGNIYVADQYNNRIRKISPERNVSTLAGSNIEGFKDGKGAEASFYRPTGICSDINGNIYVTDQYNNSIRKISPDGTVITLAGTGVPGSMDGPGVTASFLNPLGICIDKLGNIYVSDSENFKVRRIDPKGEVTTLIGNGIQGSIDGAKSIASFYGPNGITIDSIGNLFVVDENIHKIRKITLGNVNTINKTIDVVFSIYPNPSNGYFTFTCNSNGTISILNINGKLIYTKKISNGINQISMDNISNGAYFIQFIQNGIGISINSKIIVVK
ncbi:MAG: T9SS type A sorting domain-containing protein [Saprospiraceae bacterium]